MRRPCQILRDFCPIAPRTVAGMPHLGRHAGTETGMAAVKKALPYRSYLAALQPSKWDRRGRDRNPRMRLFSCPSTENKVVYFHYNRLTGRNDTAHVRQRRSMARHGPTAPADGDCGRTQLSRRASSPIATAPSSSRIRARSSAILCSRSEATGNSQARSPAAASMRSIKSATTDGVRSRASDMAVTPCAAPVKAAPSLWGAPRRPLSTPEFRAFCCEVPPISGSTMVLACELEKSLAPISRITAHSRLASWGYGLG
jgi:hypothetical protein